MITCHDVEQGSEAWHKARLGKFSGSQAYKLLSSFGAGSHAVNAESDFTGNFYTKRGHLLEDEALDIYGQINGLTVVKTGFVTNDRFPNCLYSPDGLTPLMDRLIEVKCFGEKPHMAIFNGDIPLKILAQIHFGMTICEINAAQLVIYNPKLEPKYAYKCIDIVRDPLIEKRLKTILTEVTDEKG